MDKKEENLAYKTFHQVMGLHHYTSRKLLEGQGIYPGQPPLLFALKEKDGQSQKELAKKLGVSPATITVMVRRMVKSGLIKRKKDLEDQRITRIYLTSQGEKTRRKAVKIMEEIEKSCFGSLSKEEKETLNKLLKKVKENLLQEGSEIC